MYSFLLYDVLLRSPRTRELCYLSPKWFGLVETIGLDGDANHSALELNVLNIFSMHVCNRP